jgi:predicted dienelactone hydrolase
MRIVPGVILLVTAAMVMGQPAPAEKVQPGITYKVGMARRAFVPKGDYDWRGAQTHALTTVIWYPAEVGAAEKPQWIGAPGSEFASAGSAAPDAALAASAAKFPLIVLSHGTGGSALMMAWLGEALAAHGFIAAAVNHPGNNGTETYTMQGFLLWWERAEDVSAVIEGMLGDKEFSPRIDPKRIGAAGFSLGGYTMMEIAGGTSDPQLYREFCRSPDADGMCVPPIEFKTLGDEYERLMKTDPAFQKAMGRSRDSLREPRVRAVFAIAPALGPAFVAESLKKISLPVEIVAGMGDSVVPPATSAEMFAATIPSAKITLLPGVGHYTFLETCTAQGKKWRPDLCTDAPGVDRNAVHARTAAMAVTFFDNNLR